jgi:hypothetical protein
MIEVLKQMVDVLEYWDVHGGVHQPTEEAIQAGKQAIAELESQEPDIYPEEAYEMGLEAIAYYTLPPQRTWVGLSDEEYIHITDSVYHQGHGLVAYYKAIEAKLKEKNT